VVHTHLIHADVYAIPAARAAGVPFVVSSRHNTDRFRTWLPFRVINRRLWTQTDRGIAISDAVRAFIYRYERARPGQVQTIYYGLEPNPDDGRSAKRRAALRREWNIPVDAPVVGSLCRLIEQKGLDVALDAFAQVHLRDPQAYYVIAGDGRLLDPLEKQVRMLGLADRVRFLGWRSDAAEVYDALDVFLAPSRWEGFGLVLLEAMGHRLPVVGSTAGAIPEVVAEGETGFLAPPGDGSALVEPLAKLLADQALRQKMGDAGRRRLEKEFSVEKMVSQTIALYEDVIS
jgi:glycosyltransferase involved in cell wall biosynthesis